MAPPLVVVPTRYLQVRSSIHVGLPRLRASTKALSELLTDALPLVLIKDWNEMSSTRKTRRYPVPAYHYGYPPMMWPLPWQGYPPLYGYLPAYPTAQTPEAELDVLESYREQLEVEKEAIIREIEGIEARIEELKKLIKEEATPAAAPPMGPMPFWGPAPYGPAPTPDQERQMLGQQAEALERQIEAIKRRLEELRGE